MLEITPAQHKKRGPNREHRCGAGQIPSEGQVRTSHNSRVLKRGQIMRTLVGEGIGAFIVVRHEHFLVGLEVFSFWEPPWSVIYGILSL